MMKVYFLILTLLLPTMLVAKQKKPNIIFILMDDMGYSDISCYGAKKVKTPNLDRMAAEGMKFTDFHTAASICSPSRAAFLTGAYPQRCGLYMGINPKREAHWFLGLHLDEITIAEQAKSAGYITSMIGKWHLGSQPEFSPLNQGFDFYYGASENMGHSSVFKDQEQVIYEKTPLNKLTELYTERLIQNINDFKDKPFFIYYAHNYPHTPYKAGPRFKSSSKDGVRGDIIQECDWSFGELLKALKANDILENTLIVFSSDNGPVKQEYAAPYSGTKYVSLEGGHRVPFIMYWKGTIPATGEVKTPLYAMDVFPTLTEIMGAEMPNDRKFDGVSLTPLIQGEEIARAADKPFYYYNCENLQGVRMGDWKLHLPRKKKQVPWWEQARKNYKSLNKPSLYNLTRETAEKTDLSEQHPHLVDKMITLAEEARRELGEFMIRGTGQRPTGSLYPELPILSNQKQDWDKLTADKKGKAITEFPKRKIK